MAEEPQILLTPRERDFLARHPEASLASSTADPAGKPELKGVGGWLVFLAISLLFLGPIVTVGMTASEIGQAEILNPGLAGSEQWGTVVTTTWAMALGYCAVSVFAGYRLIRHHVPRTVPIVIGCMWVAGPALGIFAIVVFGGDAKGNADVGRSFVTTAIWTAYLLRSKRVKNTYAQQDDHKQVSEIFS